MIIIRYIMIFFVFLVSFIIGNLMAKKYTERVNELKEFQNAINIIETKIKFTYEPLAEIFLQISKMLSKNISSIFLKARSEMKNMNAEDAWNKSLKNSSTNLNKEDIENIKNLGRMLGETDKEGQVSQLELTKTLIEMQIEKANIEEQKNAKLYKTLGTTIGLAFVIILI